MNILYIHTHDSGRVLGPYGYAVPTPNLEAFAKQAAVFRNCYCAGPTCSPSRAAMLSGTYPHQNGMLGLAQRGFSMDYEKHLVRFLNRNGYRTVLDGIQHEAGWYLDTKQGAETIGYQEEISCLSDGYRQEDLTEWDKKNADRAAEWIGNYDGKKPFFLSYGMYATHRRFPDVIDRDINEDFVLPPGPIPDSRETRKDFARYMTSAKSADLCVGRVLDALKEKGLMEETVILVTTDHGLAEPFCKCTLFDSGIGVALLIRAPGKLANGHVIDGLVSHLDVFPTLCDLLGIEKPGYLEGVSAVPMLDDPEAKIRDEIFAEVNFHTSYEPIRCIRTERYKYIRYYDASYLRINQSNIDESLTKDYFNERGLKEQHKYEEALYDRVFEGGERRNLAGLPEFGTVEKALAARLDRHLRETDDPIRNGGISVLPEWKVNRKECLTASSKNPEDYVSAVNSNRKKS